MKLVLAYDPPGLDISIKNMEVNNALSRKTSVLNVSTDLLR